MNTKDEILDAARLLFNRQGVMNVTLRDVAASLKRSYGNVTYHFRSKESVLVGLFEQMNAELAALHVAFAKDNILNELFELPNANFDITTKYLFFSTDYIQLKRTYPRLFKKVDGFNDQRKAKWKGILLHLIEDGSMRSNMEEADIDYIMFLSASVRLAYFQIRETNHYSKSEYAMLLNRLLRPYLSPRGMAKFKTWERKFSGSI